MSRVFGVFIVLMFLFCFYGMYMSVHTSREFQRKCTKAGGVPFMAKHAWACLDPKAFKR